MCNQSIKIAVIGAEGSGKSSLVHRFVHNEYPGAKKKIYPCGRTPEKQKVELLERSPYTDSCDKKTKYQSSNSFVQNSDRFENKMQSRCTCHRTRPEYKTVVWEGPAKEINLMHVSVLDIPTLESFPEDTLQEFASDGAQGVRTASVFILVFDVMSRSSFEYISKIRSQIRKCWYRREQCDVMLPYLFPWKASPSDDIVPSTLTKKTKPTKRVKTTRKNASQEEHSTFSISSTSSDILYHGALAGNSLDSLIVVVGTKVDQLYKPAVHNENTCNTNTSQVDWYKYTVNTIRKSWKSPYLDCSAKYGFNVQAAFLAAVDGALVARGKRKKTRVKKGREFCV